MIKKIYRKERTVTLKQLFALITKGCGVGLCLKKSYCAYGELGQLFFGIIGSPPKGSAVYRLPVGTMIFGNLMIYNLSFSEIRVYTAIRIIGLDKLFDGCVLDGNGAIIDYEKKEK